MAAAGTRLRAEGASAGYDGAPIFEDLDIGIPEGGFTVIIGPNACGKSTLLRLLAGLLPPRTGRVLLEERDLADFRGKELARRLGLLPQSALAPDGITVAELVARGRFPHQTVMRQWGPADEEAVAGALAATNTAALSTRLVSELSGGQRQRVWVAMALAQATPTLLLDEPTTFLDIAHQIELLDLLRRLHREGRTLVAVLHDVNQAARYATHVIAMKDGRVVAEGAPQDIFTVELIREVFGLECVVIEDPITAGPLVVPRPSEDPV